MRCVIRTSELFELAVDLCTSDHDVFGTLFFLEPLTYLVSRFACFDDIQPVSLRSFRRGRGKYFDNIAVRGTFIYLSDDTVDLCAYHTVSDTRVYSVSKVDESRTVRESYNVALRSKYENLVVEYIDLERL